MFWSSILLALRAIRRNLMRSFLTILGIVIGVGAVITMVTLGNGATRAVSDQIASLGSNLVMVRPGKRLGPGRDEAGSTPGKPAWERMRHSSRNSGPQADPAPRRRFRAVESPDSAPHLAAEPISRGCP